MGRRQSKAENKRRINPQMRIQIRIRNRKCKWKRILKWMVAPRKWIRKWQWRWHCLRRWRMQTLTRRQLKRKPKKRANKARQRRVKRVRPRRKKQVQSRDAARREKKMEDGDEEYPPGPAAKKAKTK